MIRPERAQRRHPDQRAQDAGQAGGSGYEKAASAIDPCPNAGAPSRLRRTRRPVGGHGGHGRGEGTAGRRRPGSSRAGWGGVVAGVDGTGGTGRVADPRRRRGSGPECGCWKAAPRIGSRMHMRCPRRHACIYPSFLPSFLPYLPTDPVMPGANAGSCRRAPRPAGAGARGGIAPAGRSDPWVAFQALMARVPSRVVPGGGDPVHAPAGRLVQDCAALPPHGDPAPVVCGFGMPPGPAPPPAAPFGSPTPQ